MRFRYDSRKMEVAHVLEPEVVQGAFRTSAVWWLVSLANLKDDRCYKHMSITFLRPHVMLPHRDLSLSTLRAQWQIQTPCQWMIVSQEV